MKAAWPLWAAAATSVQVGAALAATRLVVGEASPVLIAFWRYAIGFLCLLPFCVLALRKEHRGLAGGDWLPIAALGMAQFGVVMALLNLALQSLSAARVSLIFASFPLLTMLLAAAHRHERLTLAKSAGVGLTLIGVAVGLRDALGHSVQRVEVIGAAAAFGAALVGAWSSVLVRPYLLRNPTLPLSTFAMFAAVVGLAAWAGQRGDLADPLPFSAAGWHAVVFIGLSSGIGFLLWSWALRHASATRVTVFLGLSPLTAALLDALWLDEAVSAWLCAGTACLAAGLWLALRAGRTS